MSINNKKHLKKFLEMQNITCHNTRLLRKKPRLLAVLDEIDDDNKLFMIGCLLIGCGVWCVYSIG